MKYCILMGSPRRNGNTASLIHPLIEELTSTGAECEVIWLHEKTILPCVGCRKCQDVWSEYGCPYMDASHDIFNKIMTSDVIILATPIYSWYCTAPMKALLDRLVYGMNKYYGNEKGPALWAGKKMALLTTCGYPVEKGADLFQLGMERYCKHSQLIFAGAHSERDPGYQHAFMDDEKESRVRAFAHSLQDDELVSDTF